MSYRVVVFCPREGNEWALGPDMGHGSLFLLTPPAMIWYRWIILMEERECPIPVGHNFKIMLLVLLGPSGNGHLIGEGQCFVPVRSLQSQFQFPLPFYHTVYNVSAGYNSHSNIWYATETPRACQSGSHHLCWKADRSWTKRAGNVRAENIPTKNCRREI